MTLKSKLAASVAVLGLGATMAVAEGLERVNLDTSFMYEAGSFAEFSYGAVNPSVPATLGSGLKINNVAKRFTVSNLAAKTQISENLDVGLWSTSQAMGVGLDWAPIGISADLTGSALVGLVRYTLSENFSVMGGLKRVQTKSGASVSTPISALSIASSTYTIGSGNVTTGVYGVAYQRPEMALRVELLMESEGEMTIDTTYSHTGSGGTQTGKSKIGLGDAMTLSFQSGIAPNTLLFGSIRNSRWQNNQVSVPLTGMPVPSATLSTFGDGQSYNIGIGRKFSDTLSGTISTFYDPASGCDNASALAPTCENRSISLGAKVAIADGMNLSLGTTWSRRGLATVAPTSLNAKTDKSVVTSVGAKLSYNF